jgi:hypothetical protein
MESRMLIKIPEPGHSYSSRQARHCWHEIGRTKYNIVYECCMCSRHHHRKLAGEHKLKRLRKIRRIMTVALDGQIK